MLSNLGALSKKYSITPPRKTKSDLEIFLKDYDESDKIPLISVRGKINLINAIIHWWENANPHETQYDEYQSTLRTLLQRVDVEGLKDILAKIGAWLKCRNGAVLPSPDEDIEVLFGDFVNHIEEGKEYARQLDSIVVCMKKSNAVRKTMKMRNY